MAYRKFKRQRHNWLKYEDIYWMLTPLWVHSLNYTRQRNMLVHFQWISSLHTSPFVISPPFPDFSNWHPCASHLKSIVTHLQPVKAEDATSLSIMRAFQTSSPTQAVIHSVPQAAAMPLSFRSKVTEFTTCILLSTAHEVSCPVSAGHFLFRD